MATSRSPYRSNRTSVFVLILLGVVISLAMLLSGSGRSTKRSGTRQTSQRSGASKGHVPLSKESGDQTGQLNSGLGRAADKHPHRYGMDDTPTSGPRSITGHVTHPNPQEMRLTIPRPFADAADRARPSGDQHVRDRDWRKQFPPTVDSRQPTVARTSLTEIRPYIEWDVHQTASDSLGRMGSAAVPALMKALSNPDPKRRAEAAWLLGRIGPDARPAVHALVGALKDTHPEVKKSAARALGQIGPDAAEAVGALMDVVNETAPIGVTGDPDVIRTGL